MGNSILTGPDQACQAHYNVFPGSGGFACLAARVRFTALTLANNSQHDWLIDDLRQLAPGLVNV